MRISTTYESVICLDAEEGCIECPAVFDIEGHEYPAEPYSWGDGRGTEISCRAELVSFTFGRLSMTREQAEAVTGAGHLIRQEGLVSGEFADAHASGLMAAE